MNTYLLPLCSEGEVWIKDVRARSLSDAEDKLTRLLEDEFDLPVCADWEDCKRELNDIDVNVGELYDIDEF